MKQQLSRERLNKLHEALDRQLESMDQFPLTVPVIATAPHPVKVPVKLAPNVELEELQRKLIHLEKKMEKINLEGDSEPEDDSVEERQQEVPPHPPKTNPNSGHKAAERPSIHKSKQGLPRSSGRPSRELVLSSKKKQPSYDIQESPLKRKYQVVLSSKQSPKVQKRKSLNRSSSGHLKEDRLNLSRRSISQMSQRSSKSLNRNPTIAQQFSRMERIQQDLGRYKLQNKKLRIRVKALELMEAKYQKLRENFQKSEVIRKQQKLLIQNYKSRAKPERD